MSAAENRKETQIVLEPGETSVILLGDIRVVFNPLGCMSVYGQPPCVTVHEMPRVGKEMRDGSIYAGFIPETGEAMYVPQDIASAGTRTWDDATRYAAYLEAHGRRDWGLPTPGELSVLFEHRAKIGGFPDDESSRYGWCWSSKDEGGKALLQGFGATGSQVLFDMDYEASVCPVRLEKTPRFEIKSLTV